uniref:ATP synthase complex subunit 8 n=1 Tax=Cucujoidea sp. 14 KM-2017 TaxID=2219350 RepID=A0A346RFJ9_9CUCU|nr:ATP synthase F0 subunit 8 [Cucujoidea sp. 14 KM-2017]
MPQMADLNWLMLFIYFILIFLFLNSLIYFNFLNINKKINIKKNEITNNWKW